MFLSYWRVNGECCRVDGESENCGARFESRLEVKATTRTGKVESTLESARPEPVYAHFDLIILGLQSTTREQLF